MGTRIPSKKLEQIRQRYLDNEVQRSFGVNNVRETLRRCRSDEENHRLSLEILFSLRSHGEHPLLRLLIEHDLQEQGLGHVVYRQAKPISTDERLTELLESSFSNLTSEACVILSSLYRGEYTHVFYPHQRPWIENPHHWHPLLLTFGTGVNTALCCFNNKFEMVKVSPGMVYKYFLECWLDKGPDWEKARDFVIDLAEQVVEKHLQDLKTKFDRAVAVAEDGNRICNADWVVVDEGDDEFTVYPGQVFQDNKMLISESWERKTDVHHHGKTIPAEEVTELVKACVRMMGFKRGDQPLLTFAKIVYNHKAGTEPSTTSVLVCLPQVMPDSRPENGQTFQL